MKLLCPQSLLQGQPWLFPAHRPDQGWHLTVAGRPALTVRGLRRGKLSWAKETPSEECELRNAERSQADAEAAGRVSMNRKQEV